MIGLALEEVGRASSSNSLSHIVFVSELVTLASVDVVGLSVELVVSFSFIDFFLGIRVFLGCQLRTAFHFRLSSSTFDMRLQLQLD